MQKNSKRPLRGIVSTPTRNSFHKAELEVERICDELQSITDKIVYLVQRGDTRSIARIVETELRVQIHALQPALQVVAQRNH